MRRSLLCPQYRAASLLHLALLVARVADFMWAEDTPPPGGLMERAVREEHAGLWRQSLPLLMLVGVWRLWARRDPLAFP